jgi:hypothetical protein
LVWLFWRKGRKAARNRRGIKRKIHVAGSTRRRWSRRRWKIRQAGIDWRSNVAAGRIEVVLREQGKTRK